VFLLVLHEIVEKLDQVISENELGGGIVQICQILLSGLITLLTIIIELQHGTHIAGTALLILPIGEPPQLFLLIPFLLKLFQINIHLCLIFLLILLLRLLILFESFLIVKTTN
jgi:hypothetical protein